MQGFLSAALYLAGLFTLVLGTAHFFFPRLLDFHNAIPKDGPSLRPFRLGPIRYQTKRQDVHGIAWVMNHAASYTLVTIGIVDLLHRLWWDAAYAWIIFAWIAGWWLLRAFSQLYLGKRRGDWLILLGFLILAGIHVWGLAR